MERILEYVDRNYTDKLLLTEIAEQEKAFGGIFISFFQGYHGNDIPAVCEFPQI